MKAWLVDLFISWARVGLLSYSGDGIIITITTTYYILLLLLIYIYIYLFFYVFSHYIPMTSLTSHLLCYRPLLTHSRTMCRPCPVTSIS
jgi:hypothetical protein